MADFETTLEVKVPTDPFERIIGQDDAVGIARLVATQRRHLLLVGPPGTGKSMIAQAIASVLPRPKTEIYVYHNPANGQKPLMEIKTEEQLKAESTRQIRAGKLVQPAQVPAFVAERLGFRCKRCGAFSASSMAICPQCGAEKYKKSNDYVLDEEIAKAMSEPKRGTMRVLTSRHGIDGREEQVIYEKTSDDMINMMTPDDLRRMNELNRNNLRKVIVPLNRSLFVQVSGASETELLGDVRHDPYGSHPQLGTPSYVRVVPGAVHEAHEGVLYVDELATMGPLQKFILTAMQDKTFPIVGRNPTSSGASVRVDGVPCDFILVGSVNITDLPQIIPPLRSRIRGDGYELLVQSWMPDTPANRKKIAQFVAQEIVKDGKIPHAEWAAVDAVIAEAKKIAKGIDNANGLTLRLRNLSGIVKLAGDLAVLDKSLYIQKKHVQEAMKNARPIEEQIGEKYDSWWKAGTADYGVKSHQGGPETA